MIVISIASIATSKLAPILLCLYTIDTVYDYSANDPIERTTSALRNHLRKAHRMSVARERPSGNSQYVCTILDCSNNVLILTLFFLSFRNRQRRLQRAIDRETKRESKLLLYLIYISNLYKVLMNLFLIQYDIHRKFYFL